MLNEACKGGVAQGVPSLRVRPAFVFGTFAAIAWAVKKATGLNKEASWIIAVLLVAAHAINHSLTSYYPYGDVLPK